MVQAGRGPQLLDSSDYTENDELQTYGKMDLARV